MHACRSTLEDPTLSPNEYVTLGVIGHARFEQGRFAEAEAFLTRSYQLEPHNPMIWGVMVACAGHLGRMSAAAAAAREAFEAANQEQFASSQSAADYLFRKPEHQQLFLEGLALGRDLSVQAA